MSLVMARSVAKAKAVNNYFYNFGNYKNNFTDRVGGALQSPSSHTTVQALLHTAVPTKCLTTIPIAFSS